MTLDEARAHIGAGVVYNPGHGRPEDGQIVRVSDQNAYEVFAGDRTPKATPPGALTLLAPHQNESLF